MPRLFTPLTSGMSLEERFHSLDASRSRIMDRAREHASYVLPYLMETETAGYPPGTSDNELPELFWHKPGQNANQLANKITGAIFPTNGTPFFEFTIGNSLKELRDSGQMTEEEFEGLDRLRVRVENDIHGDLQASNFRSQLQSSILKIIILPADLMYVDDDLKFRTYRIDEFVVRRDISGEIAEIMTRDWVQDDLLPDELRNIPRTPGREAYDHFEPYFTQISYDKVKDEWNVVREFRGKKVDKGTYKKDALPYFYFHWAHSPGEVYGTSLVEQVFGLIRSGEATAKALVEGLVAGSQGYLAVSPTGVTTIEDIYDKPNWSIISAREEDVRTIQPNTSGSVVTADSALRAMEEDLDEAFMTNSSARLQGERVTAFQVNSVEAERDESLGGMLTFLGDNVQRKTILRLLAIREKNKTLPKGFKKLLDDGHIKLNIKTGLDALGRQLDTIRLQAVLQTIGSAAQIWPEMAEKINGLNVAEDLIKNSGLDVERYGLTLEKIQEKRQAAQQQQIQQAAAGQAIQSAGSIAEQQLGGQ